MDNQEWTIKSEQSRVAIKSGQGAISSGQSRENGSVVYTRRRGNQEWTIKRGESRVDNQEKLVT